MKFRGLFAFLVLSTCVHPAFAQTATTFAPGQTIQSLAINSAFQGKADVTALAAVSAIANSALQPAAIGNTVAGLTGGTLTAGQIPASVLTADGLAGTALQPAAIGASVAGLTSGKVPLAQLPTGTTTGTLADGGALAAASAIANSALQPAAVGVSVAPLTGGKVPSSYLPTAGSSLVGIQFAESLFPEPTIATGYRYMLAPGDTALYDYSQGAAGAAVSFGSSAATILPAGALHFTATAGPINLPVFSSTLQTQTFVVGNAVEAASLGVQAVNPSPSPLGYSTAGTAVSLSDAYYGFSASTPQGYGTRWLNWYQQNIGAPHQVIKTLDNGIHVITLLRNTAAAPYVQMIVDGVLVPGVAGTGGINTIATGEHIQIGGADGRCSGTPSNCYYTGDILYADGTASLYTLGQVQQEQSAALQWVKTNKGFIYSPQIENAHYNIGFLSAGESVNSGHDATTPATQNYSYYSAKDLQAGYVSNFAGTGYVVPQSANSSTPNGVAGLLTVSAVTSGTLYDNEVVTVVGGATETVLGYGTGLGGTGTYYVGASQTVGTSGAPVALTGISSLTVGAIQIGGDNATGPVIVEDLNTALNSIGQNWDINFVDYYVHGNTMGAADGLSALGGTYWSGIPTDPYSQNAQDITRFFQTVLNHTANDKWLPVLYTDIASKSPANSATHGMIANPFIRNVAQLYGYAVVDPVTDARFSPANGGSNNTTQNCTPDEGGASYTYNQTDLIHPTPCGNEAQGHMDAAVKAWKLNYPWLPETGLVAASFMEGMKDYGRPLIFSGSAAQSLTLQSCTGYSSGEYSQQIQNLGSGTLTINAGSGYNGGAAELINGAATATIAATDIRPRILTPLFGGDVNGGCSWSMR